MMAYVQNERANHAPIAIGGIGGSGTRLVAELVAAAGVHLGDELNAASDNLWFTLLFKRPGIVDCDEVEFHGCLDAFFAGMRGGGVHDGMEQLVDDLAREGRPQHPAPWLKQRAQSLLDSARKPEQPTRCWGWKEPNTHVVIERLWQYLPDLRYIHVVRNGLDMAFSGNQNQLQLWGPRVLGGDGPIDPARSLAYWCRVHRRMQALLAANAGRMYWLDYDVLCRDPERESEALCRFIGSPPDTMRTLFAGIRPAEVARHSFHTSSGLAAQDIAFARSLGYAADFTD